MKESLQVIFGSTCFHIHTSNWSLNLLNTFQSLPLFWFPWPKNSSHSLLSGYCGLSPFLLLIPTPFDSVSHSLWAGVLLLNIRLTIPPLLHPKSTVECVVYIGLLPPCWKFLSLSRYYDRVISSFLIILRCSFLCLECILIPLCARQLLLFKISSPPSLLLKDDTGTLISPHFS